MRFIVSEFAEAGLRRLVPAPPVREAVLRSLEWKLTRDSGFQARPCDVFAGRPLRIGVIFVGFEMRILFEVEETLTVWSVAKATAADFTE